MGRDMSQLVEGLHTQFQVLHALVLRETRTRFGTHQMGYLWAVIEPLFWVFTFYGLFYFMGRALPTGMDIVGFISTGIIPFIVFRQSVDRAVNAVNGNKPLLFYPQIRPLDLVVARVALEFTTLVWVFVLIIVGHFLITRDFAIDSVMWVIGGFVLAWMLGVGVGLFLLGASMYFNVVSRLVGIVMRPMFFLSGIFFTANELAPDLREYLLWNPVLHAVEMVRDGYYTSYTSHHLNAAYPLAVALVAGYLGLVVERMARKRIQP